MDMIKEDRYFDPDVTWKGLAVVITNFLSGKHIRSGADKDKHYMKESFKRLGFEVFSYKDVTTSKLTELLNEYSKRTDLDCFAFAISSHGCEMEKKEDANTKEESGEKEKQAKKVKHQAIQMFDEKYVFTHDILDRFNDTKCPGLKDKPKIFLIQACRIPDSKSTADHGNADFGFDKGCYPPQDAKSNSANSDPAEPNPVKPNPQTETKMDVDYNTPDATNKKDSSVGDEDKIDPAKALILYHPALVEITFVPCFNDMLIMFACPQGHYAFRNNHDGSYMLKLFSESVDACHKKYGSANLMDILKDVTYNMSEKKYLGSKEYKIVPSFVHKLRKDVIFH